MMGQEDTESGFETFQHAIMALKIDLGEQNVNCTTLRGETLSFGWAGPLRVNEQEEPISGFKHYDSPYCAAELGDSQMDIRFNDYTMRLDFG
jgi:hypothetical protein